MFMYTCLYPSTLDSGYTHPRFSYYRMSPYRVYTIPPFISPPPPYPPISCFTQVLQPGPHSGSSIMRVSRTSFLYSVALPGGHVHYASLLPPSLFVGPVLTPALTRFSYLPHWFYTALPSSLSPPVSLRPLARSFPTHFLCCPGRLLLTHPLFHPSIPALPRLTPARYQFGPHIL